MGWRGAEKVERWGKLLERWLRGYAISERSFTRRNPVW